MQLEFKPGMLRIIAEDIRDELYLETELKAKTNRRVHARVSDGRFEDGLVLEVIPWTPPEERPMRKDGYARTPARPDSYAPREDAPPPRDGGYQDHRPSYRAPRPVKPVGVK